MRSAAFNVNEYTRPMLVEAMNGIDPAQTADRFVVGDFSSSQSGNSLQPMRTIIETVQSRWRPVPPISVVQVDLPSNDFSTLFATVFGPSAGLRVAGLYENLRIRIGQRHRLEADQTQAGLPGKVRIGRFHSVLPSLQRAMPVRKLAQRTITGKPATNDRVLLRTHAERVCGRSHEVRSSLAACSSRDLQNACGASAGNRWKRIPVAITLGLP